MNIIHYFIGNWKSNLEIFLFFYCFMVIKKDPGRSPDLIFRF